MYMPCTCSPGNFFFVENLTGTAYRIVRVHSDKRWNRDLSLSLLGYPQGRNLLGALGFIATRSYYLGRVRFRGGGGLGGLKAHAGILIRTALTILQGCPVDRKIRYRTK